jgi:hypothetical protein
MHIDGFRQCTSLCRIEIPSLVEKIGKSGFSGCRSLNEIIFSSDSHLKEISGFVKCTSLCRIELPSSIEIIREGGLRKCTSLGVVMIPAGCRLTRNDGLQNVHPFVFYREANGDRDEHMKQSRRMVHLGIGGRREEFE